MCLELIIMINFIFLLFLAFCQASQILVSAPPVDTGFRETCAYLPLILPKREIQNLILFLRLCELLPPS